MQVQRISNQNNYYPSFDGMNFKLSKQMIAAVERTTKLTNDEMTNLSLTECEKLMAERGTLKKPNKLKAWISEKYRELGEKFGLLEKEYNIYTDID